MPRRSVRRLRAGRRFRESLHSSCGQWFDVGRVLVDRVSAFQTIQVLESISCGRVLVLDGMVQCTTRDHHAYSEMLAHVPLMEHRNPRRVLIIGGGDLFIAEEVLKHPNIERVIVVEIDPAVIEVAKRHLLPPDARALTDLRLDIVHADAFGFLASPGWGDSFDIIIGDRPDPIGPGVTLYGDDFYHRVYKALLNEGVAVFQTGVPFHQLKELQGALQQMRLVTRFFGAFRTAVPTYYGGDMALTWVGKGRKLGSCHWYDSDFVDLEKVVEAAGIPTVYYTATVHRGAFALPRWVEEVVDAAKALVPQAA